jgi:hypothetical protein
LRLVGSHMGATDGSLYQRLYGVHIEQVKAICEPHRSGRMHETIRQLFSQPHREMRLMRWSVRLALPCRS